MKKSHRVMAILLSVMLILTYMPILAFADGDDVLRGELVFSPTAIVL